MSFVPVCSTAVVPSVSVPTGANGEPPVLLSTMYPTTPVEGDGAHDRSTAPLAAGVAVTAPGASGA